MADQPTSKKRQVKNPETFRERAAKASEVTDQPSRGSRLKSTGSNTVGRALKPVRGGAQRVAKTKPGGWLAKALRLLGKVLFPAYLRQSWRELKLVEWPNWGESRRLTSAVLIFAVIFGATIAIVDYGLDKLFKNILLK